MGAVELDVKTIVDTTQAEASVSSLDKKLQDLIDLQTKGMKQTQAAADASKKSLDANTTATKGLAKGFRGVGLALKAAGIGLAIAALSALKDVFMQNQTIADGVATAFETVSIVFNQVANSVVESVKEVNAATDGFDALGKVVMGLITIITTPLRLAFKGIELGVVAAQLAWEKSFLGDKDPKTIGDLTVSLALVKGEILEIGLAAGEAAVDVVSNFGGAISEIGQVATSVIEDVKEISISAAIETAKTNVALKNSALLASAVLQGLIEKYDRQAEIQRQIRDNEELTIEDRIAANERLGEVLRQSNKEQLAQANIRLASAQAELNKNKENIEAQVALQEARNEVAAINAQITGFESEQQKNAQNLRKEDADKKKEALDAEADEVFDALDEEVAGNKKASDAITAIKKQEQAANTATVATGLAVIGDLVSGSAEAAKATAAVQATFSTYEAIVGQLAAATKTPAGGIPGYAIGQAVATGAFGFLQVAKILNTNTPSTSGGAGAGGGGGAVPTAQQDALPDVGFLNRSSLGDGQEAFRPQRAYVINQDIRNNNTLDESIRDRSRV